jgi:superfamily II DNA/RNA helicase
LLAFQAKQKNTKQQKIKTTNPTRIRVEPKCSRKKQKKNEKKKKKQKKKKKKKKLKKRKKNQKKNKQKKRKKKTKGKKKTYVFQMDLLDKIAERTQASILANISNPHQFNLLQKYLVLLAFQAKQKNTKQQKTKRTNPTKIRVEPKCSRRVINTYIL